MTKFGWDLPPGVTTNMLPGNTAQDRADEALAERIADILHPLKPFLSDGPEMENVHENVELEIAKLVSETYSMAYKDAQADDRMEREALGKEDSI